MIAIIARSENGCRIQESAEKWIRQKERSPRNQFEFIEIQIS